MSAPDLTILSTTEEPSCFGEATVKAVLGLADGARIEVVRVPASRGRQTLCASTQVGCKLGCAFCQTGRCGFTRDLSAAEIVGQLDAVRARLGWRIDNLAFMGMGEPLDNLAGLLPALATLLAPPYSFGQERVRISTAGLPEGIARLARQGWRRLNLTLSLNAATDALRDRLMPINRAFPLAAVQAALLAWPRRRSQAFGVSYCLLPGVNDSADDAAAVAAFCRPLGRVALNVIPYNPLRMTLPQQLGPAEAPSAAQVERFCAWLAAQGLHVRERVPRGRGLAAGCGQLGARAPADTGPCPEA